MSTRPEIVVLAGGLGGARLAMAAVENGWTERAAFVTNVADDWEVGDLLVCPDTDAVFYGLTGRFDEERGWGVRGDTFPGPRPGEPAWFGVGNQDRAHHEQRRRLMSPGSTLSDAMAVMTRGTTGATVVPVTNHRVRTVVRIGGTWRPFQSWLIRHQARRPDEVRWKGVEEAKPSPGVIEMIEQADTVVVASSSPVASIGPILAVPGIRSALIERHGPVVALCPISSRPITSDRDERRRVARMRLMEARGMEHTPLAVAEWLSPVITHFAVDHCDAQLTHELGDSGVTPLVLPVVGADPLERAALSLELVRRRICHA